MKSPLLTCFALLATACVHAQFSLLPQIGFEQTRATLGYQSLSASGLQTNLRAGLKADFRFKGGHGPMIHLATNPAPMGFAFRNDGTFDGIVQRGKGALQFRMEAGYQYSTKPIQLTKKSVAKKASHRPAANHYSMQRKSCGTSVYRPQCGDKKPSIQQAPVAKGLNMRLQPSVALAYLSADNATVKREAGGYQYFANAWQTALVPSLGVELGKGSERLFAITLFYTKPLDTKSQNVESLSGSKPVITAMNPAASAWGMTLGVPISLSKKAANTKAVKPLVEERQQVKHYEYKKCSRTVRL